MDIQVTKLDTLRLARIWAERDKEPEMLSRVGSFYNFGYSHVEKKGCCSPGEIVPVDYARARSLVHGRQADLLAEGMSAATLDLFQEVVCLVLQLAEHLHEAGVLVFSQAAS